MRIKPRVAMTSLLGTIMLASCIAQTSNREAANTNAAAEKEASGLKTVRRVATIHMPGNGGFTDYMVVSPETYRLYAGYRTENKIVVIDTQTNTVVAAIGDLAKVCSIALVPERKLGFT